MIEALEITNFLVFEDLLPIRGLRRVNLIAGKNNSGKTALLEALRIYEAKGDSTVVCNIVKKRGSFFQSNNQSFISLLNRKSLVPGRKLRLFILMI